MAVVAPAGSMLVAGVPDEVVLVYTSDATARLVDGYHPHYRTISRRTRRRIEELEHIAIERADLLLYPTEWAASSAIDHYGADEGKMHVIPWGANMPDWPAWDDGTAIPSNGVCRLLFVGVDWREKGGDIAVKATEELIRLGIDAKLTICGCSPPHAIDQPWIEIVPFLNKQDPEHRTRLESLYRRADFFLLPTRADCYGIAFCEASSYGLPSITTSTGGVPGVVIEGENGHLLPPSADGAEYAGLIAELFSDQERLKRLKRTSRAAFESRLNWRAWADRASGLIKRTIAERTSV